MELRETYVLPRAFGCLRDDLVDFRRHAEPVGFARDPAEHVCQRGVCPGHAHPLEDVRACFVESPEQRERIAEIEKGRDESLRRSHCAGESKPVLPIFEGAFCVSSREADMGTRLAGGGLHVVR